MALNYLRILGNNIRRLRNQLDLTQEDVADKANINPSYLGRIERGEINVTIETITAIAHALNVDIKEFFSSELASVDSSRLRKDIEKSLKRLDVHQLRLFRDLLNLI